MNEAAGFGLGLGFGFGLELGFGFGLGLGLRAAAAVHLEPHACAGRLDRRPAVDVTRARVAR